MSKTRIAHLVDQVARLNMEEKYELMAFMADLLKLDEEFILSRHKEALADKAAGRTIDAFEAVKNAKVRRQSRHDTCSRWIAKSIGHGPTLRGLASLETWIWQSKPSGGADHHLD